MHRSCPATGLPAAIIGNNSYGARGYGDLPPTTVIVLGDDAEGVADTHDTCTLAARVRIPHGVENEESGHADIYVCRNLKIDGAKAWPLMLTLGRAQHGSRASSATGRGGREEPGVGAPAAGGGRRVGV